MRAAWGVAILWVLFVCSSKNAQAYSDELGNPTSNNSPFGYNSPPCHGFIESCTAVASVYNVGTGNQTDPEIYFDGGQDIYSTTGVLNLQLEVLHGVPVNYTTSIHNRYYNSLGWTSDFGAAAIGYIDQSFAHGVGTFQVHAAYNDDGLEGSDQVTPGYFNLGFSSDAPKTLHTFNTTVLSKAFLPESVTLSVTGHCGAKCKVVMGS
ncbi:hypothetical protein WJX77_000091 [Trebouxia sp. C0004]